MQCLLISILTFFVCLKTAYCTANPGEVSEKQSDCFFFGISYFCSFCFSGRGEGVGIWEDLVCRRAAGGAVGNGLDVGD